MLELTDAVNLIGLIVIPEYFTQAPKKIFSQNLLMPSKNFMTYSNTCKFQPM